MNDWQEQRRQQDARRRAAVMDLPTLEVRHHAVVSGRPGEVRVIASVGPAGEVMTVWAAAADMTALTASNTQPGWATFPDSRASRPVSARVTVNSPEQSTVATLSDLPLAHITVQPLPQGRILVVGARARWRPEGPDRNAIIYDADGRVVVEETLGDGIEHVFTTSAGHVWVGYFDEGVFGSYGWGEPKGPPPLGVRGLLRFTPDLQLDWRFPSYDDHPWGSISDCYALNVDGDTAWTCYYTDFPIVRVHDGVLTGWRNDIHGARALGVDGLRVALYGGYGSDRDRLIVGHLEGEHFHITGEYRVVLPSDQPMPTNTQVIGRGVDLHLLAGDDWYRLSLEDIR